MKNTSLLLLFTIILLTVSCKESAEKNNPVQAATKQNIDLLNDISGNIIFPDTVYIGQKYDGEVRYESVFDTFTKSFDDKKKNRYSTFSVGVYTMHKSDDELKATIKDTFGATDNHTVYFYDVAFKTPGVNYIEGFLEDHILIPLDSLDKDGDTLFRYVEKEIRITKPVLVLPEVKKKLTQMEVDTENGIKIRNVN